MNSILVVTERFTVGGLETHIQGELKYLVEHSDSVDFAVGGEFMEDLLAPGVSSITRLQFDDGTVAEMVSNIDKIRKVIRDKGIDVVHAHPFASMVPACLAAELEGVPYIVTLHGPASLFEFNDFYAFLFKSVLLSAAACVVVVSPEMERLTRPFVPQERLLLLPNGVDFDQISKTRSSVHSDEGRWLVVSRLDEAKSVGVYDFIRKAKACGIPSVAIAGDGPAKDALMKKVEVDGLAYYVEFLGLRCDVIELMDASAGVAGMGRVMLEGIASSKPVILVGYDGVKGVVDRELFERAAQSNFSGRGLPTLSDDDFCKQYQQVMSLSPPFELAKAQYHERDLWSRFREEIESLKVEGETILSAIYHTFVARLPELGRESLQDSHEVVSILMNLAVSSQFFDQRLVAGVSALRLHQLANESGVLRDLAYRQSSILENETETFRAELQKKSDEVGECREELQQLKDACASIKQYQEALLRENEMIKRSLSWRISRPFRGVGYLIRNPAGVSYGAMKALYWALPVSFRRWLQGPRHRAVRLARQLGLQGANGKEQVIDGLSWEHFSDAHLSARGGYRGIYIIHATIAWNVPLFQRPQHMAMAMARLGYLVLYKTPPLGGDAVNGFREVEKRLWITNSDRVDSIRNAVRSIYSTDSVADPAQIERFTDGVVVYEYIDHIDPQISGDAENIRRLMHLKSYALNGGADLVVASARALLDEVSQIFDSECVALIPNGVDTRHYRQAELQSVELPDALISFRQQYPVVVGYFGALAPWLWYEMLEVLIAQRSDLGFVFIGPDYYEGASQLPNTENLLYLGPVEYQTLPAYARLFDVCFIPFAPGEVAQTTSPLKLFEYFALEKPVVATSDMRECVQFEEVFHGNSASAVSEALDYAIAVKDDLEFRAALRRLADNNDWDERARRFDQALDKIGT